MNASNTNRNADTLTAEQQALLKAFDADYTAAFTALQNAKTDIEALSRTAKLAQITNARNAKLAQLMGG